MYDSEIFFFYRALFRGDFLQTSVVAAFSEATTAISSATRLENNSECCSKYFGTVD